MNVHAGVAEKAERAAPRAPSAAWLEALAATAAIEKNPDRLLCHLIGEQAQIRGSAPALLSDRESFSFSALSARIGAYARWANRQGLGKGDRVALMMSNRPEFVAIWLGLSSLGVVTALINASLTGRSLAHCLRVAHPSQVIVEAALVEAFSASEPDWSAQIRSPVVWCHGAGQPQLRRIDTELTASDDARPFEGPRVGIDDKALLIYTSGTTGLPKAAYVSHRRVLNWALWFKGLLGNSEADRMYNCLPLCHSVGGVVAVLATLVAGGSTVIAEKFSARRFWDDIHRWECTQVQYIGELCRYLLSTPPGDGDGDHGLRLACGNGLRADIWTNFQDRFRIPQIVEFYAATEGTFSLFNVEGKPGAIGRIPSYLRHRFPIAIVKFDVEAGAPLRGSDGLCIPVDKGEAGEAIGRIGEVGDASGRFEGYTEESETERKLLRDVFAKGDRWFRTGDLMRINAAGFYYFVDRIGDTFRWKGENVSTLEVANVLAAAPGVNDAVVYGVDVPGADGKAGMALVDTGDGFDLEALCRQARTQLPAYAVPLFVRIGAAGLTGTFKHQKQDLVRQGFDPSWSGDAIFVLQAGEGSYRRLDAQLHAAICAGKVRF